VNYLESIVSAPVIWTLWSFLLCYVIISSSIIVSIVIIIIIIVSVKLLLCVGDV